MFPLALRLARDHGRAVLLGDSPYPSRQHLTHDVMTRQLTVVGTQNDRLQPQYGWWTRMRQMELFYSYLQRGQMRVSDLITHRYRPDDAPAVYRQLLADRSDTLGVLFDWRSG